MDISDFDLSVLNSISDNYIQNREYVFFDKEFFTLIEQLREFCSTFNEIFDRWRRFDKITISKSVFDYETKVSNMARFCDRFYIFKFGDFEIFIKRLDKKFYVYVDFFDLETRSKYLVRLDSVVKFEQRSTPYSFRSCPFDDFKECSDVFQDCIREFLRFDYELF